MDLFNFYNEHEIEQDMFKFFNEVKRKLFKMENSVEGETYIIDEIGDDEKYVFLTRESDNKEFQEFNISDELYNKILNDSSILKLKYENGEYKVI